jgi:hypothetical protein
MPANQFFTDWVTGDTITAAKLNTMKNSVQPYFGNYTPVNKAGDTMTGALSLPQANTTAGTSGAGTRHIELRTAGLRWGLGLGGNESGSNAGANFLLWRYDDAGNFLGEVFKAERDSGRVIVNEISGRYDHQNRFVVSAFAGQDISIPANSAIFLVSLFINIPSGKSLYIRRVRSYIGATLRFRISTSNTWTASDPVFESDVNTLIVSGSFAGAVAFGFTNLAASPETLNRGFGAWAEMEIR